MNSISNVACSYVCQFNNPPPHATHVKKKKGSICVTGAEEISNRKKKEITHAEHATHPEALDLLETSKGLLD